MKWTKETLEHYLSFTFTFCMIGIGAEWLDSIFHLWSLKILMGISFVGEAYGFLGGIAWLIKHHKS